MITQMQNLYINATVKCITRHPSIIPCVFKCPFTTSVTFLVMFYWLNMVWWQLNTLTQLQAVSMLQAGYIDRRVPEKMHSSLCIRLRMPGYSFFNCKLVRQLVQWQRRYLISKDWKAKWFIYLWEPENQRV